MLVRWGSWNLNSKCKTRRKKLEITISINVSRLLNLTVIFSLDLESQSRYSDSPLEKLISRKCIQNMVVYVVIKRKKYFAENVQFTQIFGEFCILDIPVGGNFSLFAGLLLLSWPVGWLVVSPVQWTGSGDADFYTSRY